MSLSLNDIKFPSSWDLSPNDLSYIDDIYQEGLDLGVWRKDNQRDKLANENVVSLSKYFWPKVEYKKLIMGGELMLWFFTFDDAIDAGLYSDEKTAEIVKRMDRVFMDGTLPENPTGPEKVALSLRTKCKIMCGEQRKGTFNRFITSCIQWVDSIVPFNKVIANGDSPDLELYGFLRKVNIGAYPCVTLTEVMLESTLEQYIWFDPRWIKMNENIAIVVTLVNDLVSYEKEVRDKMGILNPLFFLQTKLNIELSESYKKLVDMIHHWISEYNELEERFLQLFTTDEEKKQIQFMLDHLHYLISGSRLWSMQTPRYISNTSPFIEMRKNCASLSITSFVSNCAESQRDLKKRKRV
ncbi:hypothetical protein DLAC_07096 [Tieghemostelium lacteum]|uniref:Terpene synthase 1 n=1 Tax=Tieghemostelium lacteum TaxID=361077 RepID=TPS1_TIELA|nr:RecName: Full=Terpene synthase 1 [Tieghemostelium lacteum]AXN72969.1 terpene synthase [Tieghemostelium lacteum]KYQ92249.1 hypothetical protein DLAC_07096 [Tieghemostelium lacteum]|eukprot:KYQ92249.1 hypothetical protein DLAC_07096 [Tieghemostelium lacteum]